MWAHHLLRTLLPHQLIVQQTSTTSLAYVNDDLYPARNHATSYKTNHPIQRAQTVSWNLIFSIQASKNVMGSLKAHRLVIKTLKCLEIWFFPYKFKIRRASHLHIWAPKNHTICSIQIPRIPSVFIGFKKCPYFL